MIELTLAQTRAVRVAGRLGAVAASFVFLSLAITQGPPMSPEGPGIERDIQYIFVVIGILATLLAWRWSLPGGLLLVLTGIVLGIAAAGRFSEPTALISALLSLVPGDFHYENIVSNDALAFLDAYTAQITSPAQAALYRQTPIAYVWDDHDFGGSNSNGTSAASEAARLTYRNSVPHYELPAGEGDAAIYQAFSIGRVRFVMTDTRSMRDLETMADGSASLLGEEQREWLKQELLLGSHEYDLVVWVNAVPWIAPADGARDDWGGYAKERSEIANFIAVNGITNLMMLSGDAHMLAIDDGANTDYSDTGGAAFPLMHAAATDRPGSVKGGPYSEGTSPGAGQYGLVTFRSTAEGMVVTMSGRNWLREQLIGYEFTVPTPDS